MIKATHGEADQWEVFKKKTMILTLGALVRSTVAEPWAPCLAPASAAPASSSGNLSSTETASKP